MAVQSPAPMQIDVFSDVVCPWCFIGKRRLEQTLEHLAASGRPGPLPRLVLRTPVCARLRRRPPGAA